MNTAELMQKVAEVAPQRYQDILGTVPEVRESPFQEEILEEMDGLTKKAAGMMDMLKGMGGRAGSHALALGGVAATGVAMALAGDVLDAARRGLSKSKNYKNMLENNPDLKRKPAASVQKIFSTLHRFNPAFSGDPLVAGSFVRDNLNLGTSDELGVNLNTVNNLVGSYKSIRESATRFQLPKFDRPDKVDPHEALKGQELQLKIRKMQDEAVERTMGKDPGGFGGGTGGIHGVRARRQAGVI